MAISKQNVGWALIGIGVLGCGIVLGKELGRPKLGCDPGSSSGVVTVIADEGPRTVRGLCQADPHGHPRVVLEIRP